MNIISKIKDDFNQLTPKRQETAKEILWTAFEKIPIIGDAGEIIRLSKDFYKSNPEIDSLILIIANESTKFALSETQLECFKTAITNTFGKTDFSLSEYFYNRNELVDLLLENYNMVKIEADTSENIQNFITSFVEKIFPMIHKFDTTDKMLSSFMNGNYLQHKKLTEYLQIAFERAINHIVNDENKYRYTEELKNDNEGFEAKYNNPRRAQLFLDKTNIDENQILLKDVYVDPCIAGRTSLLEFLNNWKKFYDEKGNETQGILLLSGKAGVGKTSLVSKLIADKYFDDAAHAIFLKDYTNYFDSSSNPWKQIKKVFGCDKDEEYDKQVLILDGFDELCVLKGFEFKGKDFLLNLAEYIPVKINVKVLITSREHDGYYEKIPSNEPNIIEKTICWTEHEMEEWCDKYSSKKNDEDIKKWCDDFKKNYFQLDKKRKEIFCTPIILYICCHEKINISQNRTIADIYNKAFKNIVSREYSTGISVEYSDFLTKQEKAIVLWQLTKEVAYQMFLHDTLKEGANNDLIKKAKNRVQEIKKDILNKWNKTEVDKILNNMLDELPAIFHFASRDNKNGVEFAHKTVGEYFTAVKIYEDYFAKYNKEYFDSKCMNNIPSDVVNSVSNDIFNAFGYKKIPDDIFDYLNSMNFSIYNGIIDNANDGLYFERFSKVYEELMKTHKWCEYNCLPPTINEYKIEDLFISSQLCLTFGNLAYFLTERGFTNDNNIAECKNITHLLSSQYSSVNLHNWNFNHADLSYGYFDHANLNDAHLKGAKFEGAHLKDANLKGAHLESTNLERAILEGAHLEDAHLEGAHLEGAHLESSHLERAMLEGAHLKNTHLEGAYLNGAYLDGANLENTHLEMAYLTGTYLRGANLNGANLEGANLECANLEDAHLKHVNLKSANLENAILENANFLFANLNKTKLRNAHLKFSKFESANLESVHFERTNLNSSNLIFANLKYAHLEGANLKFAKLNEANLNNAHLNCANLEGAHLDHTNLDGANLTGATYYKDGPLKTKFPTGFNPDEAGMIAVDENNDNNRSEEEN